MSDWLFENPPDNACFVTTQVIDGSPITHVYHDFDGSWQFHSSQNAELADARIVALASVIEGDASLKKLCDLPCGWRAERKRVGQSWTRIKNHPFPTHDDDGYYLEDAVWMSEHIDDINPPDEEQRLGLQPGRFVKLIFRFRPEHSERLDNECERMWVVITEYDEEDELYTGRLDNDPERDTPLGSGDTLKFDPSHIIEILEP